VRQDDIRLEIKGRGPTAPETPQQSQALELIEQQRFVGGISREDNAPVSSSISTSGIGKFSSLQRDMDLAMQAAAIRELELKRGKEESGDDGNSIVNKAKDALGIVFIVDFFVIIFFLGWFLAAAAMQSTNPWLLERFQDIFQPVVVPSLTVLMTLSIASGVTGGKKEDDKRIDN